jgi:hypothetical protein
MVPSKLDQFKLLLDINHNLKVTMLLAVNQVMNLPAMMKWGMVMALTSRLNMEESMLVSAKK